MNTERDTNSQDLNPSTLAAAQNAERGPFYWRVASGVLYAEMPMNNAIRPPLLTEWESERVMAFRNRERRSRWLAGRALAKALVKERLQLPGVIEIREGVTGEPLVFQNGFPLPDVWLGISVRYGKVSCVLADRPVSLEVRKIDRNEAELVDGFTTRAERRILRKALGTTDYARSAGWAIKEASLRAARQKHQIALKQVEIDENLSVDLDGERLQVMAMRLTDDTAVAIVGRFLVEERQRVRIVMDEAAREQATPRLQATIERSVARARRITEAKARWSQARPDAI